MGSSPSLRCTVSAWPGEISVSDMQPTALTGSLEGYGETLYLHSRSSGKKRACASGPLTQAFIYLSIINSNKSLLNFCWVPAYAGHWGHGGEQG